MDWIKAREGARSGVKVCYLYGMGTDLTDNQVACIVNSQARISGTLCRLAYNANPQKEFVSKREWLTIIQEDEANET